jgi:hypothetical protein
MITNFSDFQQFSEEKIGVVLTNQCYDKFFWII